MNARVALPLIVILIISYLQIEDSDGGRLSNLRKKGSSFLRKGKSKLLNIRAMFKEKCPGSVKKGDPAPPPPQKCLESVKKKLQGSMKKIKSMLNTFKKQAKSMFPNLNPEFRFNISYQPFCKAYGSKYVCKAGDEGHLYVNSDGREVLSKTLKGVRPADAKDIAVRSPDDKAPKKKRNYYKWGFWILMIIIFSPLIAASSPLLLFG